MRWRLSVVSEELKRSFQNYAKVKERFVESGRFNEAFSSLRMIESESDDVFCCVYKDENYLCGLVRWLLLFEEWFVITR